MGSENEKQSTHYNLGRLLPLILANILIIGLMVFACVRYAGKVFRDSRNSALNSFSATVSAMEKMAYGYLKMQQSICNDWSKYMEFHPFTPEGAAEMIREANSNPNVMAHLIEAGSLKGISTVAAENGSYEVDYSRLTGLGLEQMMESGAEENRIYVTNMYTNPIDGMNVVSFVQKVRLVAQGNERQDYYLLRVVPINELQKRWMFPSEFADAELSLIKSDGDYIIRSYSLKNSNFWEYMRIYNQLGYDEKDELVQRMMQKGAIYEGLDSAGNTAYYVCITSETEGDWCFVGYLPDCDIITNGQDWIMTFYVAIGFLILILVDGTYILAINQALKRSAEQTREANLAKTRFLSSMSHDIRTPMNAIIGMVTIASKHVDEPTQVRDCLDKITLASNHLLTLVNDVLDISKVESGKMSLTPVVFSLSESVSNLTNIVRPNVKAKALEFEIHVRNIRQEHLYGDELRLNQIFINILSNAVKYTPEGGRITLALEEIPLPEDPKTVELLFEVTDTGIGMSREFQKNMYNAFARATDTRIDKVQGTGLGLAIVKQMVDLMDGSIECESEIGKGTKFTIRLRFPLADKEMEEMKLPPLNILLVDDDEIFLETASETIRSLNLDTDTAISGAEALEKIQRSRESGKPYQAAIVDWKMPQMDGIETTRRIHEALGKDSPIVIISSYDWTDIEEEAVLAGADSFINKPLFASTVYLKLNEIFCLGGTKEEKPDNTANYEGLHILVAEDYDLNWEVIGPLLEMSGITVDRAVNGEICVDMVMRAPAGTYDAILMDIRMPVMDGYEATRTIRGMTEEKKKDIPIIAMTADAFAEDIKACHDAGMNGYVSKPVDFRKVLIEFEKLGLHRQGK